MESRIDLIDLTAEIVSAYVGNNMLRSADLPQLIQEIHATLNEITATPGRADSEPQKPAVNPKRSVNPDYIICLEDGLKFKSLKRHLRTKYELTPEAYRRKWGLPADYPMVAPNYARARSALAKKMGLGRKPRQSRR
jgi:predicted transcriptional regulator